jgi:hypothetical protein
MTTLSAFEVSPEIAKRFPKDKPLPAAAFDGLGKRASLMSFGPRQRDLITDLARPGFSPFAETPAIAARYTHKLPEPVDHCVDGLGPIGGIDTLTPDQRRQAVALSASGFDPFAVSPEIAARFPERAAA